MGTLSRADRGEVLIDGVATEKLNDNDLSVFRNRRIGFVFQAHNLLPEFTALENVCLPGFIAGRDKEEVEAQAIELLRGLDLSERALHKPAQMSGGEQQRVAVARALINQPAVLLADEPSGNLDTHNRRELHRLFFDLRERTGQTVVIVTHDEELASSTDRTLRLVDGLLVNE
jgi:lipoprotein-releasing system ATP-binding protein